MVNAPPTDKEEDGTNSSGGSNTTDENDESSSDENGMHKSWGFGRGLRKEAEQCKTFKTVNTK